MHFDYSNLFSDAQVEKVGNPGKLRFTSTSGNPTYTQTSLTKDGILQNHLSVLNTFDIPKNQDQCIKNDLTIGMKHIRQYLA